MFSKRQTASSYYKWLRNKDKRKDCQIFTIYAATTATKYFSKSFVAGIISGLCFMQLLIGSFPKILSFYPTSSDHKYATDRSSHLHDNEGKTIADQLYNEVRVLCWVMTGPDNHETKAQHVKKTWGRRCNKLIFMSSVEDTKLGTVALPVSEGRDHLWAKTKEAFKYIYKHHLDEYDWFMKADDDTYVIVENLRKMLYEYSTEFPIFLGSKRREVERIKQGFMHGGAGYVLSKEALKRFIEKGLPDARNCRPDHGGLEDTELAACMEHIGVLAGDSRDELNRGRMFVYPPADQLLPNVNSSDFWEVFFYKSDPGPNACSDHAISFHYINPSKMYLLDYFIYHLRPFGIKYGADILPQKKSLDELITALSIPSINNNEFFNEVRVLCWVMTVPDNHETEAQHGYMHGGAGYVLSKEALKRFIQKGLPDKTKCSQGNDGLEDVLLAICMENIKVLAGDSRDEYGRGRMFVDAPAYQLVPDPVGSPRPYWKAFYYKPNPGPKCCSDHAITFHYVKPSQMYILDYLIYYLKPFGIIHSTDILPQQKSLDQLNKALSIPSINNRSI